MATLGKIRSKGTLLVTVVGVALFAFIAEAGFESFKKGSTPEAGSVYGEKLTVNEFNELVEEYTTVVEFTSGKTSLTDEELTNIKDQVWNSYISNKIMEKQAKELGLVVTDAEIQDILTKGVNPMLRQTPFTSRTTGLFDKDALAKFLSEYTKMDRTQIPAQYLESYDKMYKYWLFIEKTIRQSRLAEKYQGLLSRAMTTNKVEVEESFAGRVNTTDFLLAAIPYTSVSDKEAPVTDDDLKAIYEKRKELYKVDMESRDVKYIDVQVKASAGDRAAIEKDVKQAQSKLVAGTDYKNILRDAASTYSYNDMFVTKKAFTNDIAARIEKATIGEVVPTFYSPEDNTLNTFKVIATTSEADSVRFRVIPVQKQTTEATKQLADSISTALQAGADFAELAKKYGASAEAQWVSTASYEQQQNLDATSQDLLKNIFSMTPNEIKTLDQPTGKLIVQVTEKKAPITKYKVAAVKRVVEFSKDTYGKAYNALSRFLANNPTLDKITANAEKSGYRIQERKDLFNYEHNIGGVTGTREAMRFVYAADKGDVSPMYECGENDHLLIVALTDINEEGYRPFEKVKEELKYEASCHKKAEVIKAKLSKQRIASFADTRSIANVVTDTLKHVSFASASYIPRLNTSEPAISAYATIAKIGKITKPIEGYAGVYLLQAIAKGKLPEQFNAEQETQRAASMNMQTAGRNYMRDLYLKAKVKDNRYLYF
ncbi:MAG: SurA N-terminal domain-containing protein [Bacteroidaceae bacterium]|nr:SurA N-terminal domain-containing protein [Bacteroidaceae bacterium]